MRKISAPKIYDGKGNILENTVLICDRNGKLVDISPVREHDSSSIEMKEGVITPGFINTHCHLELSHMLGKADTGTGLLPFLKQVVGFRDVDPDVIKSCIEKEDKNMWEAGIMAVGDISNKADTSETKLSSKIRYYTFVEMFDFLNPNFTEGTIAQYQQVYNQFNIKEGDKKSFVPHAPYTVSRSLFRFINEQSMKGDTISIHNQETPHENQLFINGEGDFSSFYETLGLNLDAFTPTGSRAINYALEGMNPNSRTLFVHNTTSQNRDIALAKEWTNASIYWATCPNANLYIENKLPFYKYFIEEGATMTIGTDSLTSNWQLSIAEEIKTILKYCSYLKFDEVIQWACINGARALGFEDDLGSIEVGKNPGLVLWSHEDPLVSDIQRIL